MKEFTCTLHDFLEISEYIKQGTFKNPFDLDEN